MKLLMKHFYRGKFKTKLENWFHVFMMRQGRIIVVIYDPVATCVQDKSSVTFYFISDGQIYRLHLSLPPPVPLEYNPRVLRGSFDTNSLQTKILQKC